MMRVRILFSCGTKVDARHLSTIRERIYLYNHIVDEVAFVSIATIAFAVIFARFRLAIARCGGMACHCERMKRLSSLRRG